MLLDLLVELIGPKHWPSRQLYIAYLTMTLCACVISAPITHEDHWKNRMVLNNYGIIKFCSKGMSLQNYVVPQRYGSFYTWSSLGVQLLDDTLLQEWLLSLFIGHHLYGSAIVELEIAWLCHFVLPEKWFQSCPCWKSFSI